MKKSAIKLIAADMDGTLLNSQKEISPHLFSVIAQLQQKDIAFVVASGRQYYNLLHYFKEIQDSLYFLTENGGIIFQGRKNIYTSTIKQEQLAKALQKIDQIPNSYAVLCGAKSAYIQYDAPEFLQQVEMYYARYQIVPNLWKAAEQEQICKIAVYDFDHAEEHSYALLKNSTEPLTSILSGEHWVDLMEPSINKGAALQILQKKLGITAQECMAFGDYLNDVELMQSCYYSYAMENAHPDLKAVANFGAPSNDDDGVIKVISEYFELY